jgi:hypothetical protein
MPPHAKSFPPAKKMKENEGETPRRAGEALAAAIENTKYPRPPK